MKQKQHFSWLEQGLSPDLEVTTQIHFSNVSLKNLCNFGQLVQWCLNIWSLSLFKLEAYAFQILSLWTVYIFFLPCSFSENTDY